MNIFRCLVVLMMGMSNLTVFAADNAPDAGNLATERSAINQLRSVAEAEAVHAQQGCYARFAVSDCLKKVRRDRRAVLDDLRRREVVLNDQERKAKAAATLERLQNNQSSGGSTEPNVKLHTPLQLGN
jgi:hypothetical protein